MCVCPIINNTLTLQDKNLCNTTSKEQCYLQNKTCHYTDEGPVCKG